MSTGMHAVVLPRLFSLKPIGPEHLVEGEDWKPVDPLECVM